MFDEVEGLVLLAAVDGLLEAAAPDGFAEAPLEVQWSEMCCTLATLNEFPFAELVLVEPLGLLAVALELAPLELPVRATSCPTCCANWSVLPLNW